MYPFRMTVKQFSLREYIQRALELAEYVTDEDGVVIARVPNTSGFYAQGSSVETARTELEDVIEGNILLALQLKLPIPTLPNFTILEANVA
jgi:predicted RNase H-like HicB family nuclease